MPLQADAPTAAPPTTTAGPRGPGGTTLSANATQPGHGDQETVRLTTNYYSTRVAHDAPVGVALYFHHVLVAEQPSSLQVQVKNLGRAPLQSVEVRLASRAWAEPVCERLENLPGGRTIRPLAAILPARAGEFSVHIEVKVKTHDEIKNFVASRPVRVNAPPDSVLAAKDIKGLHTNIELDEKSANAAGRPDAPLAKMPGVDVIHSLPDLLRFKLPEAWQVLNLSLDYVLSSAASQLTVESAGRPLIIPRLFQLYVQSGTLLKLTPMDSTKGHPLYLVARPQFTLGRSRDPVGGADFITWFMPRGKLNDDRTRHLSKVHVMAVCAGENIFLRDTKAGGGSFFDGQPLPDGAGELLDRRAVLAVGGEYLLDVQPMPSAYAAEPDIRNLKLWNGPAPVPPRCRGAIRFVPREMELAHHDAVWLFTDAAFGTSRTNAVVLDLPNLAEFQGRFHHYHGCFWVENRASNDAVRINSHLLNANEISPLINGLTLQLGDVGFLVEVLD